MTETILIPKRTAKFIEMALMNPEIMSEDDTIIETAIFDDGTEMDIKLCGAEYEPAWAEAVLFKDGCEVAVSECMDDYFGEWTFEHNGKTYTTMVEVA